MTTDLSFRLRIGIDGRTLVMPLSGIGRYIIGIAQALAKRGHQIVLYLPAQPHRTIPEIAWADIHTGTATSTVARLIWGQTILPAQARRDNLDLFWGPAHRLPWMSIDSVPKVITIHDLVWRHAANTMHWRTYLGEVLLMRQSVARANLIFVDSDATRTDLHSLISDLPAQVRTVYPGYSTLSSDKKSTHKGADYVLFVGTLEPRKNLKRLLKAWQSLPSEIMQQTRLLIVGAKGWGVEKENDVSAFADDPTVVLNGFASESELNALYAGARGLVMPSLYEGFGFPIIEAQAYGVQVLTSNISSMPEIAGPDAILVDPLSVSSIKDGLVALLTLDHTDRVRRQRAIANAQRFTWEKAAADAERLFFELVHQTKASNARPARF